MNDLTQKRCVPCEGQVAPATALDIARMHQHVPDWTLIDVDGETRIQRVFTFPTFAAAMEFTRGVADIAEADGHHPALLTEWGKVTVTWWTHAIRGLHENDFIMAAKTDAIARDLKIA
ncbi:MAG: 4a-hydroxytetrahydrobiopterin dehydratase [Cyanobacteria bacterium J06648_11]